MTMSTASPGVFLMPRHSSMQSPCSSPSLDSRDFLLGGADGIVLVRRADMPYKAQWPQRITGDHSGHWESHENVSTAASCKLSTSSLDHRQSMGKHAQLPAPDGSDTRSHMATLSAVEGPGSMYFGGRFTSSDSSAWGNCAGLLGAASTKACFAEGHKQASWRSKPPSVADRAGCAWTDLHGNGTLPHSLPDLSIMAHRVEGDTGAQRAHLPALARQPQSLKPSISQRWLHHLQIDTDDEASPRLMAPASAKAHFLFSTKAVELRPHTSHAILQRHVTIKTNTQKTNPSRPSKSSASRPAADRMAPTAEVDARPFSKISRSEAFFEKLSLRDQEASQHHLSPLGASQMLQEAFTGTFAPASRSSPRLHAAGSLTQPPQDHIDGAATHFPPTRCPELGSLSACAAVALRTGCPEIASSELSQLRIDGPSCCVPGIMDNAPPRSGGHAERALDPPMWSLLDLSPRLFPEPQPSRLDDCPVFGRHTEEPHGGRSSYHVASLCEHGLFFDDFMSDQGSDARFCTAGSGISTGAHAACASLSHHAGFSASLDAAMAEASRSQRLPSVAGQSLLDDILLEGGRLGSKAASGQGPRPPWSGAPRASGFPLYPPKKKLWHGSLSSIDDLLSTTSSITNLVPSPLERVNSMVVSALRLKPSEKPSGRIRIGARFRAAARQNVVK